MRVCLLGQSTRLSHKPPNVHRYLFMHDAPSREKEVNFILHCVYTVEVNENKDNEVDTSLQHHRIIPCR